MNNIIKIKAYTLAAALIAGLIFNACHRRELEDYQMETALIPVRIDWSLSGVSLEKTHRASVWLFPHNDGVPIEYLLEKNNKNDLTFREIAVPVGVYSVLVFNETIDDNDWNSLVFTGTDRYKTFAAISVPKSVRGFYTRSESLPLIDDPDPIAAWSLDRFEVTPELIIRTRSISSRSALEEEAPDLTVIKPLPRYERVVITAYVTNLSSSLQVTGTVDGMAAGVYMASGEKIKESAVHAFILNGRVWDNENDGTTTRAFNIFGRLPEPARQKVVLDFLLTDGALHPQEEFDVTDLIVTKTESIVTTHTIDLGFSDNGGDHPITLPNLSMKAGIVVDGWDEIIIPIK